LLSRARVVKGAHSSIVAIARHAIPANLCTSVELAISEILLSRTRVVEGTFSPVVALARVVPLVVVVTLARFVLPVIARVVPRVATLTWYVDYNRVAIAITSQMPPTKRLHKKVMLSKETEDLSLYQSVYQVDFLIWCFPF